MKRSVAVLLVVAGLAGCSNDVQTPATASAAAIASPPPPSLTRPPVQTLPGESAVQAMDRISGGCFAEFGVEVGPRQPDGGQSYKAESQEALQAAVSACQQRLVDAGLAGDFAPTAEESLANYTHIAEWRSCIEAQGFDLPATISLDEYGASGGNSDAIFDGIDELLSTPTKPGRDTLLTSCPQT